MCFAIKTEFIKRNPSYMDVFTETVTTALDLCQDLKMLYFLGYKIIPDFFHPARTILPGWKIKPGMFH